MEEQNLICNYRNCNIPITDFACVTICYHIFCKYHAITGEKTDRKCHTCSNILEGDLDVIFHENINPTEDQKSVMLTGYSHKVLFDMISRAIQFWDYQINTKMMHAKTRVENMKCQLGEKERAIETLTLEIKHYIKIQEKKVNYLKREVENLSASGNNLEKQLAAKRSQLLNMQSKFEELRNNSMASIITQEMDCMEPMHFEDVCSQQPTTSTNYQPTTSNNPQPSPAVPIFNFEPQSRRIPGSAASSSGRSGPIFFS